MRCYLLDLSISECPINKCMYSDGNRGCLKSTTTGLDIPITPEQIARVRGIPMAHLDMKTEQALDNVKRILALNEYRNWLIGTKLPVSLPWIDTLVEKYEDLVATNFTGSILVNACLS